MKYLLTAIRVIFYIGFTAAVLACAAKKEARTAEEIQATFDQHRPEMQEIFAGFVAVRSDLGGRTEFQVTIEASGQVSNCTVLHSDVAEPKFGEALCVKIRSLDFGRKNTDALTITHPLDFYAP
jgi:protein TonB